VLRKYPYASREIFLLLNGAFGMAFAQRIMKLAEGPEPVTTTSQASRPETSAVAVTQRSSRDTRDVTTAETQDTSRRAAGDPAPDGANRVSFSVPVAGLNIDDADRTCPLPDDTGMVATSTPAVVQAPADNAKIQPGAANKSVAGSTTTTSPAQSGHPSVTAPKSGINKTGFIDNSDGANLRTGPAELGGQKVRDLPLPPGSRVFVSGTHPDASHWWYVTAYLDDTMVRGYVQDFRVTTELPEPTAKLHQVVSGDTAEQLAAQEYGSSVRDGHDLRYYENVLLYVNQQQRRAGITGTYQDPGVLGGGSNNVQLVAGHRIWLVSPAYARALETVVPSGSLTGGAVAKVKRFVGHLEDILHSVTRCPHYFGEIAGEYAQAIRDHEAEIIGITAGFIMAEATSMFFAATPTGVGQIAAVVIQLALSAFGAAGAVQAGVEALKHATEWLTIAWTARGKDDVIAAASKEFLKMLVAIAIAALSASSAKGNFRNALKIANSMSTGGLPAIALMGGGAGDGGAVGTGASIGIETGSLGAAGKAALRLQDGESEPGSLFDSREGSRTSSPEEHEPEDVCELESSSEQLPSRYRDLSDHEGGVSVRDARNAGVVPHEGAEPMDRHHIFPQSPMEVTLPNRGKITIGGRAWFKERGIDIDEFCVDLSDLEHDRIHGINQDLASKHWREGEWRSAIMDELAQTEAALQAARGSSAKVSRESILEIGHRMMEQFDIADRQFVHYSKSPRP